jgi:hypothetical protein
LVFVKGLCTGVKLLGGIRDFEELFKTFHVRFKTVDS